MQSLSGKTALVIGGSGGIGASTCRKLARCGSSLIVHGGHDSVRFTKLTNELKEMVPTEALVQCLNTGFTKTFLQTALNDAVKCADIICVCFGPFLQKNLHDMNSDDWEKIADLDFVLPGLILSSALPCMMKKKWGRFLLMGGTRTEHVNGFVTNAAYGAAKTAVASLVRSTALAYAQYGITCNGIFPGFTETEYLSEVQCVKLAQKMPQKRLIEPEEIAETAVHMLQQPMLNGALVSMDGGWDPSFE